MRDGVEKSTHYCEKCHDFTVFRVMDSRPSDIGIMYRNRKCVTCGTRIYTHELTEDQLNQYMLKNGKKVLKLVLGNMVDNLEITSEIRTIERATRSGKRRSGESFNNSLVGEQKRTP